MLKDRVDVFLLLIQNQINIHFQNKHGETLLHIAAYKGLESMIVLLVRWASMSMPKTVKDAPHFVWHANRKKHPSSGYFSNVVPTPNIHTMNPYPFVSHSNTVISIIYELYCLYPFLYTFARISKQRQGLGTLHSTVSSVYVGYRSFRGYYSTSYCR